MTEKAPSERSFSKPLAIFSLIVAALAVALLFFGGTIRRFVRESFMQRVTSAHYEILCPPGALSQDAMSGFATKREPLFTSLNKKLARCRFKHGNPHGLRPRFHRPAGRRDGPAALLGDGNNDSHQAQGANPQLPAAADAEALLYAAWGKPGNAQLARWTAVWLVGEWRGAEIGMAAAQVEQRLGHKKVASLLVDPGGEISSPDDRTLLGAAWISEIAEFGGADAVRKLYAAKMPHPNVAEVTKAVGHDSAGARSQMAVVDVLVSRRNAFDAARFRHADGYADGGESWRVTGDR